MMERCGSKPPYFNTFLLRNSLTREALSSSTGADISALSQRWIGSLFVYVYTWLAMVIFKFQYCAEAG